MQPRFSAYLSVFNDWDILVPALRAMAPRIAELVVVDGAYRWMAPYLERIGIDTQRSDPRVMEAVKSIGIPCKYIVGLWENELEKRMAGYRACSHRYIYRVDADEIILFDEARLAAFLASGNAVASMYMPEYIAPGWIKSAPGGGPIAEQSLLFDREQVSAEAHLHHLWLVRGPEALPRLPGPLPARFANPIAFNAHLTDWRTPETAVMRASFYTLNYHRTTGVPWLAGQAQTPVTDFAAFFQQIDPHAYRDSRLTTCHVVNVYAFGGATVLQKTPLNAQQEAPFAGLYEHYLGSLATLNAETARAGRHCVTDEMACFDLSTEAATRALTTDGKMVFGFEHPLNAAVVRVRFLTIEPPHEVVLSVPFTTENRRLSFNLADVVGAPAAYLRRVVEFQVWMPVRQPMHKLRVLSV